MPVQASRVPSYRLHKPTGLAVVTIGGRDVYLGKHDTPESRAEYDRLIAEWLAAGRRPMLADEGPGADLTINEMLLAYLNHADTYYVKNGKPTTEPGNIRTALRPLRKLFGDLPARDFGPRKLQCVRQAMIDSGLCRNEVNKRVRHLVRAFKWATAAELVRPSIYHGVAAVPGLRRGRADVRESEPVKPVRDAFVDAIEPYVSRQVWAMVRIQRFSGCRPGEVFIMRTIDVDTSGRVWIYTPESHKTEHHGRERRIYLGPAAQAVLRPWLRPELTAYLFQPREAEAERRAERRQKRKTHVQPSQRDRRKRNPKRVLGDRYNARSYGHAIAKACDKAGVPRWAPNQLRHAAASKLRKQFGLDVTRACLGHSTPVVTEVYAELDGAKAAEAMERVG
jgi:integrase